MSFEIERKFLVKDSTYKDEASEFKHILQCYLNTDPDSTVRLRIIDDKAFLTIKSRNCGAIRHEWEYEIPKDDALDMMKNCNTSSVLEKNRYLVGRWEVDEFLGRLNGLVVAEIELNSANEEFERPEFIGEEVTDNPKYYNSVLCAAK